MIGQFITNERTGEPLDHQGNKLEISPYQPPKPIVDLFAKCQRDYMLNWSLQHRPFKEFDGISLLQRSTLDQETFGAYVGVVSDGNGNWRWKGRKNTARNKIIGILAHTIAGMLFPYCYAYNESNEEDRMTAQVMRILIENHLKKADYEIKFLFMMTSALVNPAVFCEVDYVQALQKVKVKVDGKWQVEKAVDELLTGINLNIVPIDQLLLSDFYTFNVQRQPNIVRVKRIPWDEAREIYANKYFIDGVDQFSFVEAGKTRVLLAGQENQTLYDISWTQADANYVQVLTFYYRPEDLEVTFVGGVYMGDYDPKSPEEIYNSNGFKHRRMSMIGDKWMSIPVYPFAKTGFEPLDPAGRFAYYKSAAFKEFWDDAAQNKMHQYLFDGTAMDVFKPIFMSGLSKVDSTVMRPGATIGMPLGASVTPYQLGPNLTAAMNMMRKEESDLSESTQDKIQSGITTKGVTAFATAKAEQNAKVILGVFATNIAQLVKDIGELVIDDIIVHTTVGEVDATIPESLRMKYQPMIFKGKDGGRDVTDRIEFSSEIMSINSSLGEKKAKKKLDDMEWSMFEDAGGLESTQRNYLVDPYRFARTRYSLYVDPDLVISRSMGTDQIRKEKAFSLLMDPRVAPFVDQEAVVDKYVLEEYSEGNPDKFKRKANQPNEMLDSIMGATKQGSVVPEKEMVGASQL